jgi:ATP-dependent RNA helicase DeaD
MTEEQTTAAEPTAAPQTDLDTTTDTDTSDTETATADRPSFEAMNLEPSIKRALDEMGYDEPMEVQVAVYDYIMKGRDMMVQARTGTGKTAAFGIPIAQILKAEDKGVQALILAPTRELALQVSMELGNIVRHKDITVVPVYGGAPIGKQVEALKQGAQVVAGTPGRVLDHIGRGTLKTGGIKLLVLDECDEMLSMGFQEEIEKILATLPAKDKRQTMLFSATIPADIERIAMRHMTDPEQIQLSSDDDISVDQIDHSYFVVSGMARTRDLLKVLEVEKPTSAIIFCNTRDDTTNVASYLRKHGYDAEAISSDLSQKDRERVLKRSRDKNLTFLVATDVAARGIDIEGLSHVINYTFPESPEVYVHRSGRTGRAGNDGKAISLVGPREIGSFYYLKLLYKIRPRERVLPSASEIATMREGKRYEEVLERVAGEPKSEFRALARRLSQSTDGERVVGMLLQRLLDETAKKPPAVKPVPEPVMEEPKRDRRASAQDDRSRARAKAKPEAKAEAKPEAKPAAKPEAKPDAKPEAKAAKPDDRPDDKPSTANGEEKPRRKRRRRSARGGSSAKPSSTTAVTQSADDSREFWEAWADEKTVAAKPASARAETDSGTPREDDDNEPGTVRLYVNIGRREDITEDALRELLAEGLEAADAERVGKIHVRNTHCYVRVPDDLADTVIARAEGKQVKQRDVVVERAKK